MKKDKPINLKKLKPHPLGSLFPQMDDASYETLCESIREVGVKSPIVLLDGQILDGTHRYSAAQKVKRDPVFRNYDPRPDRDGPDPISFVIRENLARRQLTPSQSAALAAELVEKMKESEAQNGAEEKPKAKKAPKTPAKGTKAAKAAKALNVSERSVAEATALKKADPEGFEEVRAGKSTLHAATVKASAKKSLKDRKTEEFSKACEVIDAALGEGAHLAITQKLQAKDVVKMSSLDAEEMKRIHPFILSGFKLAAALGWKAVSLTWAHSLRQLCDRTIAQGGNYTLEIGNFIIDVKMKDQEAAALQQAGM